MTSFVLIADGVVVQKQPYPADGFIAAPDDVVCGMLFDGDVYTAPAVSEDTLWADLRGKRDQLLAACDPLILRHRDQTEAGTAMTLTPEQYAALLAYRQALRDLPEATVDPANPIWPDQPVA